MKRLPWLFFFCSMSVHAGSGDPTADIDKLMSDLYKRGQFNGSILIAEKGKIIYRNAFGYANLESKQNFLPETASNIGSVSKQFTAMTIMMLVEQNKLRYDDPISNYVRGFPDYNKKVTIRHLLTHTSGIVNYENLGIDRPGITNNEILRALQKQPLGFEPGQKYEYSNSNYVLLTLIAENISGQSWQDFLKEKILAPLDMKNTFVWSKKKQQIKPVATGYDQFRKLDDTAGDGMYSTVDDLFKWDQALYTEKLVRQSALALAFIPGKVKEGQNTYGFGWNVGENEGNKFVWHTGRTAGFRAFIRRGFNDRITVIMLTNIGDSKRLDINTAILNILGNKPYELPKLSLALKLHQTILESGIQSAIQLYNTLKQNNDSTYDLSEGELNTLGYQLLYADNKVSSAIEIFKMNTLAYPSSSNAFDSLGEAYNKKGDKDQAIKSYEKAIELDSSNVHAVTMLNKLK